MENQPGGYYYNDTVEDEDDPHNQHCPCGCGLEPNVNCVYDTPQERHLKNIINGIPDELDRERKQ